MLTTLDLSLPRGGYWAWTMQSGQSVSIRSETGGQCCDLVCFRSVGRKVDGLDAHATIMRNARMLMSAGDLLYSATQRPMLRIVRDTAGRGCHDLLAGMCSQESTRLKFGVDGAPCCRGNFVAALAAFDIGNELIRSSFNIFMRVEFDQDGNVTIKESPAQPGDEIELEALDQLTVAVSVCPQVWGRTNKDVAGGIRILVQ